MVPVVNHPLVLARVLSMFSGIEQAPLLRSGSCDQQGGRRLMRRG